MRITIFGAAGNAGSTIAAEALARGHQVTAVVRDAARFDRLPTAAAHRTGDAADPGDVARLAAGQDVVVSAVRPAPGREHDLLTATKALLTGVAGTGARLLVVGGAGSLTVPGGDGRTVLDDPAWVPAAWRPIAQASTEQFALVRAAGPDVEWTYVSPPALLENGERTGRYRSGADELLIDADGNSAISYQDFAVALLDETERPRHRGARFTVAY
ncbi:NAD(P)-dependent oxidoreductase [Streptomyces sp. CA-181903]|uniref:NAD(P)-dependent oxidoreductase n=1 Tax=Streptomyces sp. CA-181903 TaxID=3240055 RepID=UPI003D8B1B40